MSSTRVEVEEIIGPASERFETLAGDFYSYKVNVDIEVDHSVDADAGAGYAVGATLGAAGIILGAAYLGAELSDSASTQVETILISYEDEGVRRVYWVDQYFHVQEIMRGPPSDQLFEVACLTASLGNLKNKTPQFFIADIYAPDARHDWNTTGIVAPDAYVALLWYRRAEAEGRVQQMLELLPQGQVSAVERLAKTWVPNPHDCLFSENSVH